MTLLIDGIVPILDEQTQVAHGNDKRLISDIYLKHKQSLMIIELYDGCCHGLWNAAKAAVLLSTRVICLRVCLSTVCCNCSTVAKHRTNATNWASLG